MNFTGYIYLPLNPDLKCQETKVALNAVDILLTDVARYETGYEIQYDR